MLESWGGRINFKIMHEFRKPGALEATVTPIDEFEIDVIRPLVVLLNWDGVPRTKPSSYTDSDYFHDMLNGPMDKLKSLMGYTSGTNLSKGIEVPNFYCTLPSSTFPSHTTIYTGDSPSRHNIVSNSFYDRATLGPESFTGADLKLIDLYNLVFASGKSPLDQYIEQQGVSTLYQDLDEDYKSLVVAHSLKLGRTKYKKPSLTLHVSGWDRSAFIKADKYGISKGKHYDLITIYTWDTDHTTHADGMTYLDGYLDDVDAMVQKFYDEGIVANGLEDQTIFVLFDDHGRITITPGKAIYPGNLTSTGMGRLGGPFFNAGFSLAPSFAAFTALPTNSALMGHNGVMTEVFLRKPGANSWSTYPQFSQVTTLASELWDDNAVSFFNQLKYVLLIDKEGTDPNCSSNYCGMLPDHTPVTDLSGYLDIASHPMVAERLQDLAGSPNAPSIILVLKSEGNSDMAGQDKYFFDDAVKQNQTVHGSFSTHESNVLFFAFYPKDTSKQAKISDFVNGRIETGLTRDFKKIFLDLVKKTNEIYMNP
jgi:hypothetical protein